MKTEFSSIRTGALCAIAIWVTLTGSERVIARTAPTDYQERAGDAALRAHMAALALPEAARKNGGSVTRDMEVHRWMVAPSLKALAKVSEMVVVGQVVTGRPILSQDQTYISTVSSVRILETVKGTAPEDGWITVVVPGGKMTSPDGSSAETRTPGLDPLLPGGRFVLFLERMESFQPDEITSGTAGAFVPKLGPQGVFELRADGVRAQGRDADVLKRQHDKESVAAFLSEVRQAK